tara:strand:+ start:191 stop:502 length:312 start_codon:yes stop_codon:yes gene_type:complete
MNLETEIYQILKKHKLTLKKREEVIVDLLVLIKADQAERLNLSDVIHWVAIKEQKPPNKNKRYLTFKDGEMIFQNWHYTNGNGYWYDYLGVTHWTEIPKPPCL